MWEKRRRRIGLCRYSEYYVGRPSSRTTTESYKETVFELKPDQIKVPATCLRDRKWHPHLSPCSCRHATK